MHARLRSLHWIVLVVHRRSGAGQIEDGIDFDEERKGDVVTLQFKARIAEQMLDVAPRTAVEVVDAQHFVTAIQQSRRKMRADEPSTACHQRAQVARFPHGILQVFGQPVCQPTVPAPDWNTLMTWNLQRIQTSSTP